MINLQELLEKLRPEMVGISRRARFNDGWLDVDETASYASATSITLPVDIRGMFPVGVRVRFMQSAGTWKYFNGIGSSLAMDDTATINLTGGSDYSVANEAITRLQVSYLSGAQPGWPGWFAWAPTLGGYSANPTNAVYRFCVIGNLLSFIIREAGNGTSNAATLTISTPVTAKVYSGALWGGAAAYVDNGTASTAYGRWVTGSGESALTFGVNPTASGGFTTSGSKRISFCQGFYEI